MLKGAEDIGGKRGKKAIYLETSKEGKGKFGRWIGVLYDGDRNINEQLVLEGHAHRYDGGKREEFGE